MFLGRDSRKQSLARFSRAAHISRSSRFDGSASLLHPHSPLLPLQDDYADWSNKTFVGVLSYKIAAKVKSHRLDAVSLIEDLVQRYSASDVIALLSPRHLQVRDQAQKTHGLYYIEVFHELLRRLNFDEPDIVAIDRTDAFFSNYWVATPQLMLEFIDFMGAAIHMLELNEQMRFLMSADSKYREGHADVARAVWGTSHYQLHPFICERLAVVFFWSKRVCTILVRSEFRSQQEIKAIAV